MADKDILISNLLAPGTKFKVTDTVKDNTILPGSSGFISFTRGVDESYQNICKTAAIITRTGKGGKPRIMSATLCTPVFYMEHGGFNKLMPESGSKKNYVHIERDMSPITDIRTLPPLEFIGYATAISRRIKQMSDQCRHKKWPEAKSNPINILKRMPDYFGEDPEHYLSKYSDSSFVEEFIDEARRMMSSLIRVQIQLDLVRANAEVNAAEFLLFANKGEFISKDTKDKTNEYQFTEDNDMLSRTIKFHKGLNANIKKLYDDKKNKS